MSLYDISFYNVHLHRSIRYHSLIWPVTMNLVNSWAFTWQQFSISKIARSIYYREYPYWEKHKNTRNGATGESSKDYEGDEGARASFKKGKAERARTVQPGEKVVQGLSVYINIWNILKCIVHIPFMYTS